jgi:C-methyltransferase
MQVKEQLKSFFTDHWKYMAVSAACKLDIFDAIKRGANTIHDIANQKKLDKEQLRHLLNALVESGFLEINNGFFLLNAQSELLTEDHEDRLKYACQIWSSEHLDMWQNLPSLVKSGKSPFIEQNSQSYFVYLNNHPEKLEEYHKAMDEYARDDYKSIGDIIDFSVHHSVLDVGGGLGTLIRRIKQAYPGIKCHLMDLKMVVDQTSFDDIEIHAGDFFLSIPQVADGIVLSRVLHDWNDEHALVILTNCYTALPEKGRLYIIENCLDGLNSSLPLLNLNMGLMCDSFERSSSEYEKLAHESGFSLLEKRKLNELQTVLIVEK